MDSTVLEMLRDPGEGYPLQYLNKGYTINAKDECLLNTVTGIRYEIKKGIPILLKDENIFGANQKYQRFYDRIAPLYNLINRIYYFLRHSVNYLSEEKHRRYLLEEIEVAPGDKVLEVAVGPGSNLRYLPEAAEYYGIDISMGMLNVCKRNLKRWKREVRLFQAQAENLPFKDNTFEVVYHIGGFNLFNDRKKALYEMIRVAKPGGKIVIIDETVQSEEKAYKKVPVMNKIYSNKEKIFSMPIELVPECMEEVKVKEIYNGILYCLSFKVPHSKS